MRGRRWPPQPQARFRPQVVAKDNFLTVSLQKSLPPRVITYSHYSYSLYRVPHPPKLTRHLRGEPPGEGARLSQAARGLCEAIS